MELLFDIEKIKGNVLTNIKKAKMEKQSILTIEPPDPLFDLKRVESIFPGGLSSDLEKTLSAYLKNHHLNSSDKKDWFVSDPNKETAVSVYDVYDEAMIRDIHGYIRKYPSSLRLTLWQIIRFCEKYPEYLNPRNESANDGNTLFLFVDFNSYPSEEKFILVRNSEKGLRAVSFDMVNRNLWLRPRLVTQKQKLLIEEIA